MRVKCSTSSSSTVHYSEVHDVQIGTPQGSCLGPLLFLIFCIDLYLNLQLCKGILFADDTTIYNSHENIEYLKWTIIHDMTILLDWFKANHLSTNSNKTVSMLFSKDKSTHVNHLLVENINIQFEDTAKFLGIWIDKKLSWCKVICITFTFSPVQKTARIIRSSNRIYRI